MNRNTIIGLAIAVIVAFAVALFFNPSLFGGGGDANSVLSSASEEASVDLETEQFSAMGSEHIGEVGVTEYNSNPPTSGPHLSRAPANGSYPDPLLDEQGIHGLEHGGIWITYQPDLDADSVELLSRIATFYSGAVVLSPRAENDAAIIVASWGRFMKLDAVDVEKIGTYIVEYTNTSPEPFSSLD